MWNGVLCQVASILGLKLVPKHGGFNKELFPHFLTYGKPNEPAHETSKTLWLYCMDGQRQQCFYQPSAYTQWFYHLEISSLNMDILVSIIGDINRNMELVNKCAWLIPGKFVIW
jgi:hypothetical protein